MQKSSSLSRIYSLQASLQHPLLVGHKGQKTEKDISEKGEKQPIQTKYFLNAV